MRTTPNRPTAGRTERVLRSFVPSPEQQGEGDDFCDVIQVDGFDDDVVEGAVGEGATGDGVVVGAAHHDDAGGGGMAWIAGRAAIPLSSLTDRRPGVKTTSGAPV